MIKKKIILPASTPVDEIAACWKECMLQYKDADITVANEVAQDMETNTFTKVVTITARMPCEAI